MSQIIKKEKNIQHHNRETRPKAKLLTFLLVGLLFLIPVAAAETWPYFTPPEGAAPLEVQFFVPAQDVCDSITWDFGDGKKSNIGTTTHTYEKAGLTYPELECEIPGGNIEFEFDYLKILMVDSSTPKTGKSYPIDYKIKEDATQTEKFSASQWASRGTALTAFGFYDSAVQAYAKSVELDDKNADIWNSYATALKSAGNNNKAADALNQSVTLDSSNADNWYSYGIILDSLNRYDEALYAFEEALKINDYNADFWYTYANTLASTENFEEAVEAYAKSVELDSAKTAAWLEYGDTLVLLEKLEEAETAYEHSVNLDDKNAEAWFSYGKTLSTLGKNEKATEAFNKVSELKPTGSMQHIINAKIPVCGMGVM